MSALAERYQQVRQRLSEACQRAGRDPADVQLVAVSKRHSADAIREVYGLGQRSFGENYAQELHDKARQLADLQGLRWHFIGGFQRNKARDLARDAQVVETLASAAHGQALQRRAEGEVGVFVQVNVGGEAQKAGCTPQDLPGVLEALSGLSRLRVRGLMTIPPAGDPDAARRCYAQLRTLAQAHGLRELSMGMSADLEIAVEEGATLVRVGTAIFGPRPDA